MTDALMDRIKAHRSAPDTYDPPTFEQMADRIEQLERGRDALKRLNDAQSQMLDAEEARAEQAEAKLAKAVETLREIETDCDADYPPSHGAIKYVIRAALAELEGEE